MIELENVSYRYPGGVRGVSRINASIREGEFVAILGQNGSGKSTLSKLCNGLLHPTEGRVRVGQRDTQHTSLKELASMVGYVFQNPDHQIFAETVWKEVAFGARNVGCSSEECRQRVQEALAVVGLTDAAESDPFSLTKGERQRVAVASVLAARPRVLIFDEPTTGLDAEESQRMLSMIRQFHENGHTILIITHAMGMAAENAQRVLVMNSGEICGDGPLRTVFANPESVTSAGLALPVITQLSQRWGHTLLTVDEFRASVTPV